MLQKRKKSTFKWGRALLPFLVLTIVGVMLFRAYYAPLTYEGIHSIQIAQGDSISKLYPQMSKLKQLMLRYWVKKYPDQIPTLQEGSYTLMGSYSKAEFFDYLAAGPQKDYARVTLLEGWSIYDSDAGLARKHYIAPGAFVAQAKDSSFIQQMQISFPFLTNFPNLISLEGFLYPETYFVNYEGDFISNLIKMQLKEFEKRVWIPHKELFLNNTYTPYQLLSLASIIEAEEKTQSNRAMIAGIFFNRLKSGMRLDADISLCYGLQSTLADCTEAVIRKNLDNSNNPYNTRRVAGFTPTPINSPSLSSIKAVLSPQSNSYYYYLHDKSGKIHYGKTLDEHNQNKKNYL